MSVSSHYFRIFQTHDRAPLYPWHVDDAQMLAETGVSRERERVCAFMGHLVYRTKHCDKHCVSEYKHGDLSPNLKGHRI